LVTEKDPINVLLCWSMAKSGANTPIARVQLAARTFHGRFDIPTVVSPTKNPQGWVVGNPRVLDTTRWLSAKDQGNFRTGLQKSVGKLFAPIVAVLKARQG
jgi:hypothetical protein